jgi:putative heme-binding domain-containing protein
MAMQMAVIAPCAIAQSDSAASVKPMELSPSDTMLRLERSARDESAGGLDCYKIETANAIYYLDKIGAGLSSIIDRDGNDWLSFHPKKGSGATGEFRGFPNAVFKEKGSYFHPRNAGTDPCVTFVEEESPDRVVISALSSNEMWAGQFTFTSQACTFTLTKKPPNRNYWVLYEGTPGGQYDDSDWWMTSASQTKSPLTVPHEGDIAGVEWIAFGDQELHRTLFLHHLEDDDSTDRFYQMEKKMTVFGFGRDGMKKYLSSVPQSFSIGIVESTDFEAVGKYIANISRSVNRGEVPSLAPENKRAALERFALTSSGNAQAGRHLFFHDERTKCSTCHRAKEDGVEVSVEHNGDVGPDLSKIGGKFDRPHLIESLLTPSQQIVEGYRTSVIVTDDGKSFSGIVKARDSDNITLIDAQNKPHKIATASIEEHIDASVSLMPTGLADALTPQEFTDLLAYLESLRTDKPSFGSGVTGPIQLPPGFEITTVATGLSGATALDIAPDGRIFVCEQQGTLRVIKNGKLLDQPFATIPVELNWERGLIGVTLAPEFPVDPYVYVVYVAKEPYTHHRVSRFRANGDVAVADSEEILLKGDDQNKFGGNVPAGHQGGAIHFGTDGKLYIGLGEQTAQTPSQRFDALQGKILRINSDGSIPTDNPFLDKTTGKYQSIWAIGCRNPFTFAVRKLTGEILINDVGGKYEEINRGVAGANYGWPTADHGPTDRDDMVGPIHIYPEASISGGDFSDSVETWPPQFQGKYFFADFVHGWIKTLDLNSPETASDFAFGLRRVVDLRFSPDGSLYVLLRNAWIVDDKFEGGTSSLMRIQYRVDEP